MPPKRKNSSDTTKKNKKRAKPNTNNNKRNSTTIDKIEPDYTACERWYQKYEDTDDPEQTITPEGAQRFFKDLDVSLDSAYPILIGWKLNASRMGYFTKDEWLSGMKLLGINSIDQFKSKIPVWLKEIENEDKFKQMYLYTFGYAKTTGQKSMDIDVAIALWNLLLGNKYDHVPVFNQFLQENKPVKVINKDQWSSLLDFISTVPFNLEDYDSTSSWPVLFDEYATWRLQQLNK